MHETFAVALGILLLSSSLAAGVMIGAMLGGIPLLLAYSGSDYVRIHQLTADRYEPFQPICVVASALSGLVILLTAPTLAVRVPAVVSVLCSVSIIFVSTTRNVPLKRAVKRLDPNGLPATDYVHRLQHEWARWSTVRSVLAVAALCANFAILTYILWNVAQVW